MAFMVLQNVLFFALAPIAFFWGRRAYRIFIKKDYSEVALKKGESPANPKKWAPYVGIINLTGALICAVVFLNFPLYIMGYGLFEHHYNNWSAIAGSTIWMKLIIDFIIRQQAHPMKIGRKKKPAGEMA